MINNLSHRILSRHLILAAAAAVVLLAACGGQSTPIAVYVTATPAAPIAAQPSPAPAGDTASPAPAGPLLPTIPPGVTYSAVVGPDETLPPVSTSLPTPLPTLAPGVTFGPIIPPDYTLAPTETRLPPTPIPTLEPTAGPSPTPGPGLRRDLMGIQIHPHIDSREFDRVLGYAQDLNVAWIKFQFNWSLLESSPNQYTELFYMLRQYVQQAHLRGFKVMLSIAKAPGWSRTPDANGQLGEGGPPDDPQALANFLGGMLSMIGRDVNGAPYVSAVEVWNEPNLAREWYNHPMTGEEYMRYFRPAYDAIRAFAPEIVVITAAPAPTGDSAVSTNDRTWLQQLYNAGLAQYGANVAVGIHPYGWANAPDARCCANPSRGWDDQPQFYFLNTIEDYHAIMERSGHAAAQLWATEFGWATFDGLQTVSGAQPGSPPDAPYFSAVDRWQQAQYTLRAFQLGQALPYMGPMMLWNLNFSTIGGAVDRSDPQSAYGLLDSNWQPRPVYLSLQQAPKN